jgi:hypothetical protein
LFGIEQFCASRLQYLGMPSPVNRRLEDQIRQLCARAVDVRGEDELHHVSQELRTALREHLSRLKHKAVVKLVKKDEGFQERRAA